MATTPIIGTVTVGGTSKTISGGYVNIGGVWKPIAKTYVNINGVWKNAWKDLYTWKKYTVSTTTAYNTKKSTTQIKPRYDVTKAIKYASNYTFNTSTGVYTLNSPTTGTIANLTTSKKYYMLNKATSGSEMNEFISLGTPNDAGQATLQYYIWTSTSSDTQEIGTYIEDVTSENESEYPTNGVHTDGYWYVKQ